MTRTPIMTHHKKIPQKIENEISRSYEIGHAHGSNPMRMMLGKKPHMTDKGWGECSKRLERSLQEGSTIFELSKSQTNKFDKWRKRHKKVYTGASGGRYTFCFTPTGLGMCIKVKDGITKKELDLSECENW